MNKSGIKIKLTHVGLQQEGKIKYKYYEARANEDGRQGRVNISTKDSTKIFKGAF